MSKEEGISLSKFLHFVGQLRFRGTSVLFRLPRSPVVKKTKSKSHVRELSPTPTGDGDVTGSGELDGNGGKLLSKPPGEKKVGFVGLEPIGEGERGVEEEMEVGEDVRRGGKEEVDGDQGEGMHVVPDETLPLRFPLVKVKDEEGREQCAAEIFPSSEGEEFTIATHFVKVSQ